MNDLTQIAHPQADGRNVSGARPAGTHIAVAIVVPALNEERYIADCLRSLIGQWPAEACEILVLDGGSTDRTREIVAELAAQHPMIRLIHNEARLQSAAMNLAAIVASPRAAILVRADAHAAYPPDFVRSCVVELLRTGATSVVVPMLNEARPGAGLQRAIAAAQSSRLGNGGSPHRTGRKSGFVEHGHHAVFDRRFFMSIGGYDATFTHNEDAELDHRAQQAGGRIWMHRDAAVTYFPRTTLAGLAAQYIRHGRGRGRTLRKHGLRPRPRQMAPVVMLLGTAAAAVATPFIPVMGLAALAYPLACCGWGLGTATRRRDAWLAAAGPALMTMHFAWGVGFLQSMMKKRPASLAALAPLELPGTDAPMTIEPAGLAEKRYASA